MFSKFKSKTGNFINQVFSPTQSQDTLRNVRDYDCQVRARLKSIIKLDRDIRPLFCELIELVRKNSASSVIWIETARWIKFEEDVEAEGDRWSKPHVATICQNSVKFIKKSLINGTILFDIKVEKFEDLVDQIMNVQELEEEKIKKIKEILLSKHAHQFQHDNIKHDKPSQKTSTNNFLKKLHPESEAANILVGTIDYLEKPIVAFVRLLNSCVLGDVTEVYIPTKLFYLILGPKDPNHSYHEIGRAMSTLLSDEIFQEVAYKCNKTEHLLLGIEEFLDQCTILPPGEWDPSIRIEPPKKIPDQEYRKHLITQLKFTSNDESIELQRTNCIFGGLISDIKRKAPFYLSDFKDALSFSSISTVCFMYFAILSTIITFSGVLQQEVHYIGVIEGMLGLSVCGVIFHLFSGQPLIIINSIGPMLVFETIIYKFCKDYNMGYLSFRFWIAIWIFVTMMVIIMTNLCTLAKYISRFTQEIFAMLIAIIFCYEAFVKLLQLMYKKYDGKDYYCICHLNFSNVCNLGINYTVENLQTAVSSPRFTIETIERYQGFLLLSNNESTIQQVCQNIAGQFINKNTFNNIDLVYPSKEFFFSCFLFLGTLSLAMFLKLLPYQRYFTHTIRNIFSKFSVLIAILIMLLIDVLLKYDTEKMYVPSSIEPTVKRNWIVNVMENPVWTIFAGIIPALLACILIYMDQSISAVIVNRKENKLNKSAGYHLDMFLIVLFIPIMALFGFPWFLAAPVLSMNHIASLTIESEANAPGEQPRFIGIREQRVTGLLSYLLVGLSVFFAPVLLYIPISIFYGIFMFMGISSTNGLQMVQRIGILFIPKKYQPDYAYLRHVPIKRIHLFTIIQIVCFAILWTVKKIKIISISFPVVILIICFVRKILDYVFSQHELKWLDDLYPEKIKREEPEISKEESHKIRGIYNLRSKSSAIPISIV
ncbi:hypothetical protein A3Q56_04159 [Intoshia linei]|uniref:Anion exchange protein n=1 Tax=Intoshia linei TaxID=1819745 RepID=A0A177B3C7_9BILA|nr:hypothetical protein A3Q56_04159 [Intoshia linei]